MPRSMTAPVACAARAASAARPALTVLATLALAGCASAGPGADDAPAPSADDRIEMERGPCFGTCPMYRLTIHGDGRVRFVGNQWVEATGAHETTIPAADVAALFAYADSIRFFALPPDITPANEAACGGAWTDMPSAQVTIEWAERAHTVNDYHGCPKAPQSLRRLEERIDAVAGAARWIGGDR